jgi:hypothetical protein
MGSLLRSQLCHYCGEKATTEDHIVPRAVLPKPMSKLPYWFRSNDVVPACLDCNGRKGEEMSDCTCDQCTWAWNTALACFIPEGTRPREIVPLIADRDKHIKIAHYRGA